MRKGGGKAKGAAFERQICKALSLWVTRGRDEDCFWRSAMSGGRASVARKKDKKLVRQAGDITATSPEGHSLTDAFYLELKFKKHLAIDKFVVGAGFLFNTWLDTCEQARHYGRSPMLIAKENNYPAVLIITAPGALDKHARVDALDVVRVTQDGLTCEMRRFDDVLTRRYRGLVSAKD